MAWRLLQRQLITKANIATVQHLGVNTKIAVPTGFHDMSGHRDIELAGIRVRIDGTAAFDRFDYPQG